MFGGLFKFGSTGGLGDVTGAASSTDFELVLFSGGTGKVIKNSNLIIDNVALTAPRTLIYRDQGGTVAFLSDIGTPAYIEGLDFSFGSISTVDIVSGSCRDSTNIFDIINGGTLTADITVSGVNGLDTGAEASSASYFCHIIADTNGVNPVASLLSLSAISPTLPSGYDVFRRIGWVRNNSSSNIGFFNCNGNGMTRRYVLGDDISSLNPLSGGTATAYTDVDLSSFMPSTSTYVLLVVNYLPNAASNVFRVRPNGSPTSLPLSIAAVGSIPSSALSFLGIELATDASQIIEYRGAASDTIDIYVYGFVDNI